METYGVSLNEVQVHLGLIEQTLYCIKFWVAEIFVRSCRDRRLSILAVLALFGWRWLKVSYAVSHERFPRAPPVGSVARCACSKQNSSISLGAAKAEVTLISAKKVIATSTHLGFNVLAP